MPQTRLCKFLCRFGNARPEEARAAFYLFLYFFLIAFSIYVIKPVKENLLIGVTPAWWPYADLITAGVIGFVVAFNANLLNRLPRKHYLSGSAICFAGNLLLFWFIFEMKVSNSPSSLLKAIPFLLPIQNSWPVPVFVFCIWSDIFIAMSVTHFWIAVNDVFSPRQAKRLVGFFVTGGLLGGIAGSFVTAGLVHLMGPTNLLLACPAILLLVVAIIHVVYRQQSPESNVTCQTGTGSETRFLGSFRAITSDSYLRILGGLLASATVVGALINYQFKIAVKEWIPNPIARTSFFGSFFLAVLLLATALHLLTTGHFLKKFGIRICLFLAPTAVLLGSLSVFLLPAAGLMVWACAMKGTDKTLDTTISQSVRELLYIPVPASVKYEAKIFIDMFVNRFAVGLGAILFWVLYRVPSFAAKPPAAQVRQLAILAIGFGLIGIVLIWNIYAGYLGAVKQHLSRKWQDAHKVLDEQVDIDAARLILDTLQSRERSSTLYAMNLFQLIQKEQLSPELMEILSAKEADLKARSLDSLLDVGGEVFYSGIEQTMADKEVETMVQEVMTLDSYQSIMKKRFNDLITNETASDVERMEAARLMSLMEPTPEMLRCLEHLLQDRSPEVLNYALITAAIHRRKEHVRLIIPLLGNPVIRHAAQDALAAYGPDIEETLRQHLQDAAERPEIRNGIPDILARFGNQKAADILTAELAKDGKDIEPYLVDALYKIRSSQPNIHFKKKKILSVVLSLVKGSYTIYLTGVVNSSSCDQPRSAPDWKPLLALKVKRIFDLLALVYPPDDIVKAYQNIHAGTRRSTDFSLELLDNILDRNLKIFLFPIIEDLPPAEKTQRVKQMAKRLDHLLLLKEAGMPRRYRLGSTTEYDRD